MLPQLCHWQSFHCLIVHLSDSSSTIWSDCWPNYVVLSLDIGETTNNIIPNGETKKELVLFLLKQMVREFFDRIELSWSVQKTRMQEPAIRKQWIRTKQMAFLQS